MNKSLTACWLVSQDVAAIFGDDDELYAVSTSGEEVKHAKKQEEVEHLEVAAEQVWLTREIADNRGFEKTIWTSVSMPMRHVVGIMATVEKSDDRTLEVVGRALYGRMRFAS